MNHKSKPAQLPLNETLDAAGGANPVDVTQPGSRTTGPKAADAIHASGSQTPESTGRSRKHERQEFFLPVSGFVWLYPEEVEVLDHPSMQRLGRIFQLGQTHLVYRGATHKRLEHVLGTVHIVQRMIEAVEHNRQKAVDRGENPPESLSEFEQRFIRLGALLHDIGHLAAGHTVEDELELIGKHDEDVRLNMIFGSQDWTDLQNRTLGQLVDLLYGADVPEAVLKKEVSASEIVRMLIRKPDGASVDGTKRMAEVERLVRATKMMRIAAARDMIGNTICADLLDYLHRDWYHLGKGRPFDDRILQYMEIRNDSAAGQSASDPEQFFVISLGRRPKLRTDAVSNILDLLEWRYQLAESVLFHRTKLAAAAMLDRALYELWAKDGSKVEHTIFPLSDEQLLVDCCAIARKSKEHKIAATLLQRLINRQIYSEFYTLFYGDKHSIDVSKIKLLYAGVPLSGKPTQALVRQAAQNRNRSVALLEHDFGLDPGSLVMYCPAKVNAKIADVRIAVEDHIEKFYEYERRNDNQLSGGHLDAQLKRFDRLWRVHVFIDPKVKDSLGELEPLLRDAIRKLVFNAKDDSDENRQRSVKNLAKLLAVTDGSPWKGRTVAEAPLYGAYKNAETAMGEYPTGIPNISAFFE